MDRPANTYQEEDAHADDHKNNFLFPPHCDIGKERKRLVPCTSSYGTTMPFRVAHQIKLLLGDLNNVADITQLQTYHNLLQEQAEFTYTETLLVLLPSRGGHTPRSAKPTRLPQKLALNLLFQKKELRVRIVLGRCLVATDFK